MARTLQLFVGRTMNCIAAATSIMTPDSLDRGSRWLFRIAVAVLLLNLLDAVITLALVSGGLATEANPIMDELLGHGAMHFMVFKVALVSLSILLCWRLRQARIATLAIYGAAATYGLLAVYHIRSIDVLARFIA